MATFIFLIISISILILAHEAGHFYSARMLHVKVEEFGFGFPPRLFSRVKNGIRYSFNVLPFGGFVKIFGEHGEGEGSHESFISRPAWQRFVILFAGVTMNVVLAWFVFSVGAAVGTPELADDDSGVPVSIISIAPGSPAEQAGLRFGDDIIQSRADGVSLRIETESDVREFMEAFRGEEVTLMVRRGEELIEIRVTPRITPPEGQGPLGIAMGRLRIVRAPWYKAPLLGAAAVWRTIVATATGLGSLFKDVIVERRADVDVAGPVGIFFVGRDLHALGLAYLFQFVGVLSVNLAVLNALPIPALDGGRVFFLIIEKIKGSRVNPTFEHAAHAAGFVMLIFLMILVTYNDLIKIF